MTREDFNKLTPYAQEDFINNDGVIESSLDLHLQETIEVSATPTSIPAPEGHSFSPSVETVPPASASLYSSLDGFLISSPLELLFLIDERIASGDVKLYDWQIQILLDFANEKWCDSTPFQAVVRAANGSGKDKYVIAPCIVWACMRWKRTIAVVTSASGAQLDRQTCRYIKDLCDGINRKFSAELWNTKYREYTLSFGDGITSSVFCFATDEPKKAEGYHPSDKGCKMVLMVSEDKTVPDDINVALNKCTGYSHRVHVSTPGIPSGHFYDYCNSSILRKEISDIDKMADMVWIQYHITAWDCVGHLKAAYIKQLEYDLPGGKNGAAYKSQVDAEFGTTDEMVVIPYSYVWSCCNNVHKTEWIKEAYNKGGLDLSDGGAETVLMVRNGNKLLKEIPFKFDDTEDTVEFLNEQFKENSLTNALAYIFADMCGIGKPILDRLKKQGWKNLRYVDSRGRSRYPKTFKNIGTELFFNMRKLLERKELILSPDKILMKQLSTRYYKMLDGSMHQLLTKIEQKSRGYPSPDRADALNLAFWDYKSTFIEPVDDEEKPLVESNKEEDLVPIGTFDTREWAKGNEKDKWKINNGQKNFNYLLEEIADYNKLKFK